MCTQKLVRCPAVQVIHGLGISFTHTSSLQKWDSRCCRIHTTSPTSSDPAGARSVELSHKDISSTGHKPVFQISFTALSHEIERTENPLGMHGNGLSRFVLRRGGVTWHFGLFKSLDATSAYGRWALRATAWRHVSQAVTDMQHVTLSEDSLSRILKLKQDGFEPFRFFSQIFTSSRVKARFFADNRVLSNGMGMWVSSSSRWVVSSASSLAALGRAPAVLRLVPALLRPSFGCSMWVSECRQSCGSGIQVATLFGIGTACICPWGEGTLCFVPVHFALCMVFHKESSHGS